MHDTLIEDQIYWKWASNEEYTTKSAYQIQFDESFAKIKIFPIWKARAERKCRFFAWTLLHPEILTSNNLSKRNWLHDPICKQCKFNPENTVAPVQRLYLYQRGMVHSQKLVQLIIAAKHLPKSLYLQILEKMQTEI